MYHIICVHNIHHISLCLLFILKSRGLKVSSDIWSKHMNFLSEPRIASMLYETFVDCIACKLCGTNKRDKGFNWNMPWNLNMHNCSYRETDLRWIEIFNWRHKVTFTMSPIAVRTKGLNYKTEIWILLSIWY